MAVVAMTPRYPMGVSTSNSQMRRIRDIAAVVNTVAGRIPHRTVMAASVTASSTAVSAASSAG
jgi:hypothetical protein